MQYYYLGANSRYGFVSLYDCFPPEPDTFLHILKGGPGTGKSGFLRAIARAAAQHGLEVQCARCSGDPDSLDGVYLPALKRAWVDGTAPHVREPGLFGVNGSYVNFTGFFVRPFTEEEKEALLNLQQRYRKLYRNAYAMLGRCVLREPHADAFPAASLPIGESLASPEEGSGRITRRFLSAVSCKGLLREPAVPPGWSSRRATGEELNEAAARAVVEGERMILCPHPLDPKRMEALLFPERRLALLSGAEIAPESKEALEAAIGFLREAKSLHDSMEAVYGPHMDFPALSSFTVKTVSGLFPE